MADQDPGECDGIRAMLSGMDAARYDLSRDELIALSDIELATRFGDLACAVFDVDEAVGDQLFAFLGETLERWSPELGRAAIVHLWREDDPDALLDALDDMRRRAAARALRDVLAD